MARHTEMARRDERGGARKSFDSPIQTMERFADEVDRVFEDFGLAGGLLMPRRINAPFATAQPGSMSWIPEIEAYHRGEEFVICADLPGLRRDDVTVDVTEDHVTIQGERKREQQEEHRGVWRSERSYGRFYREIPLPSGAISDQAKASFRDGVLEISMPAPPESARRGRRLEVKDAPVKPTVTK